MMMSSQESNEKSAGRKVLQKSCFLDSALIKLRRILPIFFFYLSLTHIFPIIIFSFRMLPPYLSEFIQEPFGSSVGHGKTPQNHQGPRTCFWFVWFCLFSRCVLLCFCLLKRIFPAQSIPPTPPNSFQFVYKKCSGSISIIPTLFTFALSTLQPHIKM